MFKKDVEPKELKEALEARRIYYIETIHPYGGARFVRVSGKDRGYVRASIQEGDTKYYVRESGVIYEDLTLDEVLELVERIDPLRI